MMYNEIIKIHKLWTTEASKELEKAILRAVLRVGIEVNKEELIKALAYDRDQYQKGYCDGMEAATVHGHWIVQDNTYTLYQCSACGTRNHHTPWDFCSHCGAKMDEKEV